MDEQFWLNRWAEQRIGFHLADVNSHLVRHWPVLGLPAGSRVLVPLCGKSLDMIWLWKQGYQVLGVEFSERAIRDFARENDLVLQSADEGNFTRFDMDGLLLLRGDFFHLDSTMVDDVSAVYDRAALVALPREMRKRYAEKMAQLLRPGTRMLLVSMDYPSEMMQGPPFRVSSEEVSELYETDFHMELLESLEVSVNGTEVREQVWCMQRR